MQHDRSYYRALSTEALIQRAAEDGLNEEMAIAITERLADFFCHDNLIGCFHFDERTKTNA